jgi:hypothetical protein
MLRVLVLSILVLGSGGALAAAAPAADGSGSGGAWAHAGHVMTPAPSPVEKPSASHAGHTGAVTTTAPTGGGHEEHEAPAPADHDAAQPAAHEEHEAGQSGASGHDDGVRIAATPSRETREAIVAGFVLVNAAIMLAAFAVGLRHPKRRRRLA